MTIRRSINSCRALGLGILLAAGCASPAQVQWRQWGGPNRDFMVQAENLADKWPEGGPPRIWHRELGDGYSTIVVDDGVLYTMYRKDTDEFAVALDAKTGTTIWEHRNPSPFTPLMAQYGPGPHSTPLVSGDRLYTIGTNAVMYCYEKRTGQVLWKHDLVDEYGAPIPGRGYGCSPIAYRDTVIVPVDRARANDQGGLSGENAATTQTPDNPEGQSLIAFQQTSGAVAWKSQDFAISYASPILIDFDGQKQLVLLLLQGMMGVDPDNGKLLWHQALSPRGANIATPLWTGDGLLFCSSAYDSGSRAVKLTSKDGKCVPEELWYSRKMRMHHGNAVRIGDHVYGSSGDFGPAFFMGMNVRTGKVAWRERGFTKATCLYADGKVIILDENGQLALTTVTPKGLTIHSKCKITEPHSWAAPTLVGTTLYVRDRTHIMALDLG